MICLRGALPNLRSEHSLATRQLIGGPQKTQSPKDFVQVLYRNLTISADIGPASPREFLRASAQSPANKPYFKGFFGDPDWIRTNNLPLRRGLLYPVEPRGRAAL